MCEEEKQPFLAVAAKDRERYKKEMAVYKPARDANKPKRPGTAFMLFMGDFRKEMAGKEPEGGVAALAKLGGERWRGMTDEDKRPYVEKQNEEKIRYEANMEDYRRKVYIEINFISFAPISFSILLSRSRFLLTFIFTFSTRKFHSFLHLLYFLTISSTFNYLLIFSFFPSLFLFYLVIFITSSFSISHCLSSLITFPPLLTRSYFSNYFQF